MDEPALSDIAAATGEIVTKYRKQNQLTSLTPRLVRQEVEQALKLTAGTLDAKVYKDAVKEATSAALADRNDPDSRSKATVNSKKRKLDGNHTEVTTKKTKSLSSEATKQLPAEGSQKDKTRKESKVFKSVEIIETSDEEEDISPSTSRSKVTKTVAKAGPSKNQSKATASGSNRDPGSISHSKAEPGCVDANNPDIATVKTGSSTLKRPTGSKNESGDKSESEMSVIINATPIKKKSSKKGQKSQQDAKKAKKANKAGSETSKHEDTVKRLKSLVYACGVRKVWSKEFQTLDKPVEQIKRLREILAELGMDGRPSMEKAKAIKEKRDLAKELEDVRAFEQSVAGRHPSHSSSRIKSGARKRIVESESEGNDSDQSEHEDPLPNRKNAAHQSIMAFLGDESEDE